MHEPALGPTPDPSGTTDAGQMFVTELLRREGRVDEPPPPARPVGMYKVVAVVAGFVVLCGAVTASAAAFSGPRTERATPSFPAPPAIAGAEALRPDLINASVDFPLLAAPQPAPDASGQDAGPVPGPAAAQTATTTEGPAQSEPGADPDRGAPQPPPIGASNPPVTVDEDPAGGVPDPILSTVSAFYATVTRDPKQAFGLLDQQMQGSGYKEFRQAWADVERVRVDHIRRDGPDAALVTASLQRRDGSVLHTLQRLVINPGAQPQITDARLVSASRS